MILTATKNDTGKGSHWYQPDGSAMHTIIGANGNERNTTLRDARKLGLLPSVTTVQKDVLVNHGVDRWFKDILVKAGFTVPDAIRAQSFEDYQTRVLEDADAFGREAREFGTGVHGVIDEFNTTRSRNCASKYQPWLDQYVKWFEANIEEVYFSEETLVNMEVGYAGTTDLSARHKTHGDVVIDFKTQQVKKDKPNFYKEWIYQLGAYQQCIDGQPQCLSVVINSLEPEAPVEKLWSDAEAEMGWNVFKRACEIWQIQRGYVPSEVEVEA